MKLSIKGRIADAVKTIAQKAGGIAVGLAMLAATVAPVAAQDPPPPHAHRIGRKRTIPLSRRS
jgi:hypothetical protein